MGKKEQSSDDEFMSIKESSPSWTEREREDVFTRRMEACLEWITFN